MKKIMQVACTMLLVVALSGCQKKEVLVKRPVKKTIRVTRKVAARKKNVQVQSAGKTQKKKFAKKVMPKKVVKKKAKKK